MTMLVTKFICSSKHGGFAGSRFGWALVKDSELALSMWNVASSMVLSLSVDIELRILTAMQAVLSKFACMDSSLATSFIA